MTLPQPMVGLISTIVGIALPFVILYYTLEGYDTRFKDRQLFFTILVSLILGTVISLFHVVIGYNLGLLFVWFLPVVFGLTILETAVREALLRIKRFRGDSGLPFYGAAAGFLVGAMVIFGRFYVYLMRSEPRALDVAALGFFAVSVAFVHGGLGMEAARRPRSEWRSIGLQLVAGAVFNSTLGILYISLAAGATLGLPVDPSVLAFMAFVLAASYLFFRNRRILCIDARIPKDGESWDMYPEWPGDASTRTKRGKMDGGGIGKADGDDGRDNEKWLYLDGHRGERTAGPLRPRGRKPAAKGPRRQPRSLHRRRGKEGPGRRRRRQGKAADMGD